VFNYERKGLGPAEKGGHGLTEGPNDRTNYRVLPAQSAVIVRARSNVGPITFTTGHVEGTVGAHLDSTGNLQGGRVEARIEVLLNMLTSGNALYDSELMRRVDARRFPLAVVELTDSSRIGETEDFELTGDLTVHGVTKPISGKAAATSNGHKGFTVSGEQVIDIRDFALGLPSTLMLKIYPEVWIEMHLETEVIADV
jgi:polyisoprenoid-binding protein YceI